MNTVVVGGGPAGLAAAACLKRKGIDAVILEKGETVAPMWHRHYERLHLHTNKGSSRLPYRPMPRSYPRYPSRDQVADYLADYGDKEKLDVRLGTKVEACTPADGGWLIATSDGREFAARNLIIATGLSHSPNVPKWPGMDDYQGEVIHSSRYRNGAPYVGKSVLVVGFGNSSGEIALDLVEHGAHPAISIRHGSVVVPRDILGVPILTIARTLSIFPPKLADWLAKPLLALFIGDVSKVGVPRAEWGAMEQIATTGKVPLLDVGTIDALKDGSLVAKPGIAEFTTGGVVFTDGSAADYGAVVLGTGYLPGVDQVLSSTTDLVDDHGRPLTSGRRTAADGLFFCGFREPPTGRLREIGIEAERLADLVAV